MQFAALRMLCAGLKQWPTLGSNARRHGIDLLLTQLSSMAITEAASEEVEDSGSAMLQHSSRARTISLKPADVGSLAQEVRTITTPGVEFSGLGRGALPSSPARHPPTRARGPHPDVP